MTRGRKKDLTIPPTRALVQQRDYRARRAHYITDLEERVRKVEAENMQLRKDLEVARAGLALPPLNPQLEEASHNLMHHFSLATSSLNRFQQLAFAEQGHPTALPSLRSTPLPDSSEYVRPASFPSPAPSPPSSHCILQSPNRTVAPASATSFPTLAAPLTHNPSYPSGRKRLYREDSPEPPEPSRFTRSVSPPPDNSTRCFSSESECCGGILDCRGLVEEERDYEDRDEPPSRLSIVRSTTEQS